VDDLVTITLSFTARYDNLSRNLLLLTKMIKGVCTHSSEGTHMFLLYILTVHIVHVATSCHVIHQVCVLRKKYRQVQGLAVGVLTMPTLLNKQLIIDVCLQEPVKYLIQLSGLCSTKNKLSSYFFSFVITI